MIFWTVVALIVWPVVGFALVVHTRCGMRLSDYCISHGGVREHLFFLSVLGPLMYLVCVLFADRVVRWRM